MGKLWHRASDNYEIETELYSGPLDLLLDLIQKAELDITKLALAKVTDQFLAYVTLHKDVDPDFSSEFLVIASKLVQIKSEAMLPRPPIRSSFIAKSRRPANGFPNALTKVSDAIFISLSLIR